MVSFFKLALFAGITTMVSAADPISDIEFKLEVVGSTDSVSFYSDNSTVTVHEAAYGQAYAIHDYDYKTDDADFTILNPQVINYAIPEGSMVNFFFAAKTSEGAPVIPVQAVGLVLSTVDDGDIKKGVTVIAPDGSKSTSSKLTIVDGYVRGRLTITYTAKATVSFAYTPEGETFSNSGSYSKPQLKMADTVHNKFGFVFNHKPKNARATLDISDFSFLLSQGGTVEGYTFTDLSDTTSVDMGEAPKGSALSSVSLSKPLIVSIASFATFILLA